MGLRDLLTISGNFSGRSFDVVGQFKALVPATLSGMKIVNGRINSGTLSGAGVQARYSILTRSDVTLSGNLTQSGGGLSLTGNTCQLLVDGCTIRNNTANVGAGGGLAIVGSTIIIRNSIIADNKATLGGGLAHYSAANLVIQGCEIANNTATGGHGGGMRIVFASLTLENSTISGNSAPNATDGRGGGLFWDLGIANIRNCTFTTNQAGARGGGVYFVGTTNPRPAIASCIIAGNSAPIQPDVFGVNLAMTHSLIGNPDGLTLSVASGNNLPYGLNPLLAALANNGGPTRTHALLPGSPAIDAGSNLGNLLYDQRGAGFARTSGKSTDIGTFERIVPAKVAAVSINGGATQRSMVRTLSVTFDAAVTLPANPSQAFSLIRQSDNAMITLSAAVAGGSVTLSFAGPLVEAGSLSDGRYMLTVLASGVNNGQFDGNGDGTIGDDFALVGDTTNKLFRLFGDSDGDGDLDNTDFVAFRLAFGNGPSIFDSDGDGDTDNADFVTFRTRFGTTLP